ncbi:MAG: molybdenum ABC transporter ATP-binding protein [Rhodobacteraceae bacterium]|nr:molybdenum ABC transporter ATP-binding protein [Paracoccaceae bacterium]
MALEVDIRLVQPGFELKLAYDFSDQGITALFGASGAGKSSLLRVVAGLEPAARGRVVFGGEVWQDEQIFVPPHKRGVGYVFQDARLFSHLDVLGNLHFAARRSRSSQFDNVVQTLDLAPLLARRVDGLSGGERQRVAIGRTLLSDPRLLLMDEPLAALDHNRKADLLPYIARLPAAFGLPVLYVTHAVEEVARLAEQMVVLAGGRFLAAGGVGETLARLDISEASGKFEAGAVVRARVVAQDEKFMLTRLEVAGQPLSMPGSQVAMGEELWLRIRARDVALALERPVGVSIRNILGGVIVDITTEEHTAFAEVLLDIGEDQALRARITRASVAELGLVCGMRAYALVKSVSFDRRVLPKMV